MTSEPSRFIEIPHILGLRFKCKKCQSVLTVSPKEYFDWAERNNQQRQKVKAPLSECPVCGDGWPLVNDSYESAVTSFVERLKALTDALQKSRNPIGCSMTLEIEGEKQTEE